MDLILTTGGDYYWSNKAQYISHSTLKYVNDNDFKFAEKFDDLVSVNFGEFYCDLTEEGNPCIRFSVDNTISYIFKNGDPFNSIFAKWGIPVSITVDENKIYLNSDNYIRLLECENAVLKSKIAELQNE